jgi:hypothetical protein
MLNLVTLIQKNLGSLYNVYFVGTTVHVESINPGDKFNIEIIDLAMVSQSTVTFTTELAVPYTVSDNFDNFKINLDLYKIEGYDWQFNDSQHTTKYNNKGMEYVGNLSIPYDLDNKYVFTLGDIIENSKNRFKLFGSDAFYSFAYYDPNAFYKFSVSSYNAIPEEEFFSTNVFRGKFNLFDKRTEQLSNFMHQFNIGMGASENNGSRKYMSFRLYLDMIEDLDPTKVTDGDYYWDIYTDTASYIIRLGDTYSPGSNVIDASSNDCSTILQNMKDHLDDYVIPDIMTNIIGSDLQCSIKSYSSNYGYIQVNVMLNNSEIDTIKEIFLSSTYGEAAKGGYQKGNELYWRGYQNDVIGQTFYFLNNYRREKFDIEAFDYNNRAFNTDKPYQVIDSYYKIDDNGELSYFSYTPISFFNNVQYNNFDGSTQWQLFVGVVKIRLDYEDGTFDERYIDDMSSGYNRVLNRIDPFSTVNPNHIVTYIFNTMPDTNNFDIIKYTNGAPTRLKSFQTSLCLRYRKESETGGDRDNNYDIAFTNPVKVNMNYIEDSVDVIEFVYKNHLGGWDVLSIPQKRLDKTNSTKDILTSNKSLGESSNNYTILTSDFSVDNVEVQSTNNVKFYTSDLDYYRRLKDLVDSDTVFVRIQGTPFLNNDSLALDNIILEEVDVDVEYNITDDSIYELSINYTLLNKTNNTIR